jgi:RNase H-fold protein (predicted Holliday junction resolvase)
MGKRMGRDGAAVDHMAAAWILQTFLDAHFQDR